MILFCRSPNFVDPISRRDTVSLFITAIFPIVFVGAYLFLQSQKIDADLRMVEDMMEKLDKGIVPSDLPTELEASWGMVACCAGACLSIVVFVINYNFQFWKACEGLHLPRVFTFIFLGAGTLFFSLLPLALLESISTHNSGGVLNSLFESTRFGDPEFFLELAFPLFWVNVLCIGVVVFAYLNQKYFRRGKSIETEKSPVEG